ncbi:hypothetical protein D3C85_754700 [compost metagenome]
MLVEADNAAVDPLQIEVIPLMAISESVAFGLTVMVIDFAVAAVFSHLLSPFTVT